MKVAINGCYGGFGLSNEALKKLVKLTSGGELYFYKQTKYDFNGDINEYEKVSETDNNMSIHPMTKDLGEITNKLPNDFYFSKWELEKDRSNPLLIQIIEELGEEKSSGQCSALHIVEIPDDIEYEIDDYDGMESVEEVHRSWN